LGTLADRSLSEMKDPATRRTCKLIAFPLPVFSCIRRVSACHRLHDPSFMAVMLSWCFGQNQMSSLAGRS
jgi:hypothetical protein